MTPEPVLGVHGVSFSYAARVQRAGKPARAAVHAVKDVTLAVQAGEILGIVGESGSGKSTLIRTMMLMERPTQGTVTYHGHDLTTRTPGELADTRRGMQVVFQNPATSLNPDMSVLQIVCEPLQQLGVGTPGERKERALRALEQVGLEPDDALETAAHFSGGQKQRIAIARAIVVEPDLLFADEAVSALDVTIGAQIVRLLVNLRTALGFSMVFVSHDIAIVGSLCDRIAVMKDGRVIECGSTAQILHNPVEAYTRTLIAEARRTEVSP